MHVCASIYLSSFTLKMWQLEFYAAANRLSEQVLIHTKLCRANDDNSLQVDFGAFDITTPCLTLPSFIGKGVNFISKFMTTKFSGNPESAMPLVEYLLALNHRGKVINNTKH